MRKNRILGVAIAATLSLPAGVVYAGTFQNVNCTDTSTALDCTADPKPVAGFNFKPTNPSLINVPSDGTVYALELFGNTPYPTLPKTNKAAVLYTIDGGISTNFDLRFTLSDGAKFDGHPMLGIWDTNTKPAPVADPPDPPVPDPKYTASISPNEGGSSANYAKFDIGAGTDKLNDDDKLMLVYQLKSTTSLANEDGKVELSVSLEDSAKIPVNSAGTVTIATSKPAVKVGLRSETDGSVKISVADEDKIFATGGIGPAFQSPTVAQIGYIEVTNVNAGITESKKKIKESDGKTDFLIGEGTDGLVTTGSKDDEGLKRGSWLDITGGQFAASIDSTNTVFINSSDILSAGKANMTRTRAFFGLTDTNLQNLADEAPGTQATPVGIRMEVDDSTTINTVENPPEAKLTIDFVESYVKDITEVSSELLQISLNETVCVVYNLAGPDTQDKFSVRITNTSGVRGKLFGRLYSTDGDNNGVKIASGNLNGGNLIQPGETVVFHSGNAGETLNADGFIWEGRAMLVIISTLPGLEVMALSRHRTPGSPLSNISTGATGVSCW